MEYTEEYIYIKEDIERSIYSMSYIVGYIEEEI